MPPPWLPSKAYETAYVFISHKMIVSRAVTVLQLEIIKGNQQRAMEP